MAIRLVIFGFGLLHGLGSSPRCWGNSVCPRGQFVAGLDRLQYRCRTSDSLTMIAIGLSSGRIWRNSVETGAARTLRTGQIFYGILALAFVALPAMAARTDLGFTAETMGAGAPVFLWPVAATVRDVPVVSATLRWMTVRAYRHGSSLRPASLWRLRRLAPTGSSNGSFCNSTWPFKWQARQTRCAPFLRSSMGLSRPGIRSHDPRAFA